MLHNLFAAPLNSPCLHFFNRYIIPSSGNSGAKAAREKARKLKADVAEAEKDLKTMKKGVEEKESSLKVTIEMIEKERGPFQVKLQKV